MKLPPFAIVTSDGTGTGWAYQLQRQGANVTLVKGDVDEDDPDKRKAYEAIGDGIVESIPTSKAKSLDKDTLFLFDTNHESKLSEQLRADGRRVLGASQLSAEMEENRQAAQEIAEQYGLSIAEHQDCKSIKEGLAYLSKHAKAAFVFKPHGAKASHLTFVPDHDEADQANDELEAYLTHMDDSDVPEGFLLQERKRGVEMAANIWMHKGLPVLATVDLENKRKANRDLGSNVGCAQGVVWCVPVDAPIIKRTIGRLLPWLRQEQYTGWADMSCILGDRETWFLECGFRLAYAGSVTELLALALDPLPEILNDFEAGQTHEFAKRFRDGFGASVTLMLDEPRAGLPISVAEWAEPRWYPYDVMRVKDTDLLTGYSNDIGVFCAHDYTIQDAAERLYGDLFLKEGVSYPNILFRTDLRETKYANSPVSRFAALQAMKLL